jgi:hypothetical protein
MLDFAGDHRRNERLIEPWDFPLSGTYGTDYVEAGYPPRADGPSAAKSKLIMKLR